MTACEACGKIVPEGNAVCISCGAMIRAPASVKKPVAGVATGGVAEEPLTWERKIPLITTPYLVLQGIAIPL